MVKPNQKTHGFLPLGFQEHPCFLSCWNPGCTALPSCLSANLHPSELAPKILMQPRWLWGAVNIQVGVTNGPGVSESGLSTNLGVLSAEVWSKMQPAKKKKMQPAMWWSRESLLREEMGPGHHISKGGWRKKDPWEDIKMGRLERMVQFMKKGSPSD